VLAGAEGGADAVDGVVSGGTVETGPGLVVDEDAVVVEVEGEVVVDVVASVVVVGAVCGVVTATVVVVTQVPSSAPGWVARNS
jgi:hypothetical protein